MPQTTITRATLSDIESLVPLFDDYRQFYEQDSDIGAARSFLTERLQREQSVVFLATINGHGVGFVQLYPSFSSVGMQPVWILNDLFVAESARRTGVAGNLMQAAIDFASESGARRLALATAFDNLPAQLLYVEFGWKRNDAFIHFTYEL